MGLDLRTMIPALQFHIPRHEVDDADDLKGECKWSGLIYPTLITHIIGNFVI